MIDTHCHLTFPQLADRLDDVLAGAVEAGVDRMITVGTTPTDVAAARGIAADRANVWCAAGVHPHYAERVAVDDLPAMFEAAAADGRCAALGEMGIDYHYDDPPPAVQHALFAAQLGWIADHATDLPIIIHCRKAVDDTLAIIRDSALAGERFVFHCHTEPPDECRKVLDAGCMISFTGIVTYHNAPEVRASARLVPDERIMVETDAPYLSPEPHRKVRPNEPKFVPATAAFLAELRGRAEAQFVAQCDRNAERFFRLGTGDAS